MLANTVATHTAVVKCGCDDSCSQACDDARVTLQDRVQWILEHRFGGNASEMSRQCGLARAHINLILKRKRDEGAPRILDETARKIATASGVTTQWLLDGTEPRDLPSASPVIEHDDQYPARARAATAARALGTIGEEAIQYVLSQAYRSDKAIEATPDDWLEEMRIADRRFKRGLIPLGDTPGDPLFDEEPPFDEVPKPTKTKPTKRKRT